MLMISFESADEGCTPLIGFLQISFNHKLPAMRKIYALLALIGLYTTAAAQLTLPVDFESNSLTYSFTDFDGGAATRIDNPQSSGINTSAKVVRMVKGPGGQPWGGSWFALSGPIDFSTKKIMRMKVFSPRVGAKVLLKVENATVGSQAIEINATTTVANQWEDLSFDFGTSPIVNTYQYSKVVVIFELGTVGDGTANFTFLFDDIRQESSSTPDPIFPSIPVDFESDAITYTFESFGGGATATRIDNTQKNGINTSNKVVRVVKNGGETWSGNWFMLASDIDFSTKKVFKMKVFSPAIGTEVLFKVENVTDGAIFSEKVVTTTKANEWEDLSFDFQTIDLSGGKTYRKIVLIFDRTKPGNGSASSTFLFDDILQVAPSGGGLTQMDLPVTFNDPTVEYGLIGFGGADNSTIVTDPTDPANKVAKVVKTATAETWAGTTVTAAAQLGFKNKIPFSAGNTKMNVRVWSPDAGIKVRLKVEDHTDNTKSVETEATTTVANAWQDLTFDFSNQAAGTAAINLAYNYTKASIFFNFGTSGATAGEKTYYFDNMIFGNLPLPVKLLSFEAGKSGNAVVLQWATSSETSSRDFVVERRSATGDWSEIATVKAAGNSQTVRRYTATDKMPLQGTGYYRLRQNDNDGNFTYSEVKAVQFDKGRSTSVMLYPNPAKGRISLSTNGFNGPVRYEIMAASGASVLNGTIANPQAETGINISTLKAGNYFMKITDGNTSATTRFVVQ